MGKNIGPSSRNPPLHTIVDVMRDDLVCMNDHCGDLDNTLDNVAFYLDPKSLSEDGATNEKRTRTIAEMRYVRHAMRQSWISMEEHFDRLEAHITHSKF
jgi:hypothetical protein